jgi:UrcA family protein
MDTNLTSPNASSIGAAILSAALSIGAVAWAVTVTTGAATAQTTAPAAPAAVHVVYSDLDLATVQGANILLKRIDLAAQDACGGEPSHSPLLPRAVAHFDQCVEAAVNDAVARVGEPLVLALNAQQPLSGGASFAAR